MSTELSYQEISSLTHIKSPSLTPDQLGKVAGQGITINTPDVPMSFFDTNHPQLAIPTVEERLGRLTDRTLDQIGL